MIKAAVDHASHERWQDGLQQLSAALQQDGVQQLASWQLCKAALAWAMHVCTAQHEGAGQQARAMVSDDLIAALFTEAAQRDVSTYTMGGLRRLYRAHLLRRQLHLAGLPAGDVLDAARAAGSDPARLSRVS
jgi:hypothetical protein